MTQHYTGGWARATQDGTLKCLGHRGVTMISSGLPLDGEDPGGVSLPSGCEDVGLTPAAPCRASEVLGRVGDKWSLQVIFSLGDGARRFTDLKRGIDGISQRMLTVTLRGLERDGIVTRTMYPVMPPRVDYALTPMGRTLRDAAGA